MNKMDADYISQHDIAQRYLQGKLTPEETVEFEEYILDKPELLEQLELDSVMVEHLPLVKTSAKQELDERNGLQPSFWQVLFGTPIRASIGTALGCAMVAILLFNEQYTIQNINGIASIQVVYVENYRSSANEKQIVNIRLSSDNELLVLSIAPAVISDSYKIEIFDRANKSIVSSTSHHLTGDGELNIAIQTNLLSDPYYMLHVKPIDQAKVVYELRVSKGTE